ncbi:hypothetical protein NKR23_g832 [Pleurostoma richardsiae]|uniref:Ergosterol biosynthetic protein 28 n=1 Tax=Pleurostoma richardsiae TaxID=41990 RepID=A0AA38RTB5_9PEZI|nr:hypothetical protein NKR23_g832 [Pleurostoma richardsiae]
MDQALAILPSAEKGYLPYYLLLVGVVAVGNSLQNLFTLHYTRRIYNGQFVPNPSLTRSGSSGAGAPNPDDSVAKLVPASPTGKDVEKARDQVTPLAARLFGTWTLITGILRVYAAYRVDDPVLYQLGLITHLLAAAHFSSELLVFKTLRLTGPQIFPLVAGFGGSIWMALQYHAYVRG